MATGKEARLCTPGYGSHAANVLYVLQDRNGSNEYAVLPVYVRAPPVLGTARLACVYWYCCGETDFGLLLLHACTTGLCIGITASEQATVLT